jgi:hypothetical protein
LPAPVDGEPLAKKALTRSGLASPTKSAIEIGETEGLDVLAARVEVANLVLVPGGELLGGLVGDPVGGGVRAGIVTARACGERGFQVGLV